MRQRSWSPLLLVALLAGCGYILKVNSTHDPNANFAALHTYSWLPKNDTAPKDPRVDNDVVKAQVEDAANAVLQQKGYVQISTGQPDFLIAYHVTTADIPGDDNIPNYWGYYPIYQGGIGFYNYPVEQGTMVIDIINPTTKHMIWRGTASKQLVENDSPRDRIERLRKGVTKVMEQFPPS